MIAGVTATADDKAVATNGMTVVVKLTDEVGVNGPAVIAFIKLSTMTLLCFSFRTFINPETDTALPPAVIFGPDPISKVSVMTW